MKTKGRLSASIDVSLIRAAEQAVSRGEALTVSAWIGDAIRLKIEHDRRLRELGAFIQEYEAEYGEITPEEMQRASRQTRARALTVRGPRRARSREAGA